MAIDSVVEKEFTADELKLMDELADFVGISEPPKASDGWFTAEQIGRHKSRPIASTYMKLQRAYRANKVEKKPHGKNVYFKMKPGVDLSDVGL